MITFSKFHEHSGPIFKCSSVVKLPDLAFLNIAVCINFTIDVYHQCLMLSSHESIKDIIIIQEVSRICSILTYLYSYWQLCCFPN